MMKYILVFLFLSACASTPKPVTEVPLLVDISPDVSPFFMRQKITVFTQDKVRELDAVVQFDGKEITTVFLDPSGRPGVLLVQHGTTAEVTGPWVDKIPFDLKWAMQVIGATFALSPIQKADEESSTRQTRIGPVEDVWNDGRIITRMIVKDQTSIEYEWGTGLCPSKINVKNTKRAYKLSIETVECEEMK